MTYGQDAAFWSATASYSSGYGGFSYLFILYYSSEELEDWYQNQWFQWHSVRCVKN